MTGTMPTDAGLDSSLALLRDGYRYIGRRCDRLHSDIFRTRLMLRRAICLRGAPAARLFYDESRFIRHGAAPRRMQRTLLGVGGVQGLDDEAHRRRKQMFMAIMNPAGVQELTAISAELWRVAARAWAGQPAIVLHDEAGRLLCRAVCAWAGVPLPEIEVADRTRDLRAMIEGPAAFGPRHWGSRLARHRAERWLSTMIAQVRAGTLVPPAGSALAVIAGHTDLAGRLLPLNIAAVELLNVLRPTVAVDRFVTFAATALHEHPQWRDRLAGSDEDLLPFVQEVRRFYPFFPFVTARVRRTFELDGARFPQGTRVLLDLYGTNHHPRLWEAPEEFRPQRFRSWSGDPYSFIPQGGGDYDLGHRCAGEHLTIELLKTAVRALTRQMTYRVPAQDLTIDLRRMPALPASGVVLSEVAPIGALAPEAS
jgi:fatty-acid peroxygenase